MKRLLVLLCAAPLLALACSDDETTTDNSGRANDILALTGDTTAGQTTFESSCGIGGGCHSPDGTSANGDAADLTERTPLLTDSAIVGIILNGFGDMLPQDHLENQEIADTVAFMRSEWGQ